MPPRSMTRPATASATSSAGPAELIALLVAGLVSLRTGMLAMFLVGAFVLISLRQLVG